jgi:hypothetical protein
MKIKTQLIDNGKNAAYITADISLIAEAAAALMTRTGREIDIAFYANGRLMTSFSCGKAEDTLEKNKAKIIEQMVDISAVMFPCPDIKDTDRESGAFCGGMVFGILEAVDGLDEDNEIRKAFKGAIHAEKPLEKAEDMISDGATDSPALLRFMIGEYLRAERISADKEGEEAVSFDTYTTFTKGLEYGKYLMNTEILRNDIRRERERSHGHTGDMHSKL